MRELIAAFPETHISYHEMLCARGPIEGTIAALDITGCGVFPAVQEIIKINKDKVPSCLYAW